MAKGNSLVKGAAVNTVQSLLTAGRAWVHPHQGGLGRAPRAPTTGGKRMRQGISKLL